MEIIRYAVIGLVAGLLSGFFGIGGGIIIVPALVLFCGLTQHAATGTSLVALLLPVGILGVMNYYRSGNIGTENIAFGLILAVGLFVGAFFGSKISLGVSDEVLRKAFASLLFVLSVYMFFVRK